MELKSFLRGVDPAISTVFAAVEHAARTVQIEVSRAGLGADIYGARGTENVQGEQQQKLDVYADECFLKAFAESGVVAGIASEERKEFISLNNDAGWVVMIDPLDGSSNIDVNVAIGTIIALYRRKTEKGSALQLEDFLQAGKHMAAAAYVNYSVSTQLVMSTGAGTHIFTMDPKTGTFMLIREGVRIPEDGKVYSINEVNFDDFDQGLKQFVQYCREKRNAKGMRAYTGRYIGSLVADFHRNLLKGGIYVYPATAEAPMGKLRLLYECNPMSFLAVQAGGSGTDGRRDILEIQPEALHQRCPFFVGSPVMMREVARLR